MNISAHSMFRSTVGLLCLALLVGGCAVPLSKPLIEPNVQVRGLEITEATLGGIDAIVTLDIDNPNEVKLSASGLSYNYLSLVTN